MGEGGHAKGARKIKARRALWESSKWEREGGVLTLSPNPEVTEDGAPGNTCRRGEEETPLYPERRQYKCITGLGQMLECNNGVPLGSDPELFSLTSVWGIWRRMHVRQLRLQKGSASHQLGDHWQQHVAFKDTAKPSLATLGPKAWVWPDTTHVHVFHEFSET